MVGAMVEYDASPIPTIARIIRNPVKLSMNDPTSTAKTQIPTPTAIIHFLE